MAKKDLRMLMGKKTPVYVKKMFLQENMRHVIMWLCFNMIWPIILVSSFLWAKVIPFHLLPELVYEVSFHLLIKNTYNIALLLLTMHLWFGVFLVANLVNPYNIFIYRLHKIYTCKYCVKVTANKYHTTISINFIDHCYKVGKHSRFKEVKMKYRVHGFVNVMPCPRYLVLTVRYYLYSLCMVIGTLPLVFLLICLGVDAHQCYRAFAVAVLTWFMYSGFFVFFEFIVWAITTFRWVGIAHRLGIRPSYN